MTETTTTAALLQACIQDLHAARRLAEARLAGIAACAGEALARRLEDLRADWAEQARQFERTEISLEGPENLWMAGVLDDGERDTRSIAPGPLLDTALIGAVRKGVAADAVSLETAVAVARSLGRIEIARLAEAMRESVRQHDLRLSALLDEMPSRLGRR